MSYDDEFEEFAQAIEAGELDELLRAWKQGKVRVVPAEDVPPEVRKRLMDALGQADLTELD